MQIGQMVPFITMNKWTKEIEAEITSLLKDWLKQHQKTQKDLKHALKADSERMPVLLDILKKNFAQGGLQKAVKRLCEIENEWYTGQNSSQQGSKDSDPFGQLDLLLEEINEDCKN